MVPFKLPTTLRGALLEICETSLEGERIRVSVIPKCSHPNFFGHVTMPELHFNSLDELRDFTQNLNVEDSQIVFEHYLYKGKFHLVDWEINTRTE